MRTIPNKIIKKPNGEAVIWREKPESTEKDLMVFDAIQMICFYSNTKDRKVAARLTDLAFRLDELIKKSKASITIEDDDFNSILSELDHEHCVLRRIGECPGLTIGTMSKIFEDAEKSYKQKETKKANK